MTRFHIAVGRLPFESSSDEDLLRKQVQEALSAPESKGREKLDFTKREASAPGPAAAAQVLGRGREAQGLQITSSICVTLNVLVAGHSPSTIGSL
ncbi:MAG: hypothetical protein IPJ19_16610 [Planctomycetes bacterium]|nr:hypothetical protein [Planctomycetota bacterium]